MFQNENNDFRDSKLDLFIICMKAYNILKKHKVVDDEIKIGDL